MKTPAVNNPDDCARFTLYSFLVVVSPSYELQSKKSSFRRVCPALKTSYHARRVSSSHNGRLPWLKRSPLSQPTVFSGETEISATPPFCTFPAQRNRKQRKTLPELRQLPMGLASLQMMKIMDFGDIKLSLVKIFSVLI